MNILTRRVSGVLAALAIASSSLAGCSIRVGSPASAASTTADPSTTAELAALEVADHHATSDYDRDLFSHWISQSQGCDTRDLVLQRDGTNVTTDDDCAITGGTWVSAYDGETVTDPGDLDIDHVVPLSNAWQSGADSWDDERREAFANDLTRPQLIAVTASSNRSKGDKDPTEWKPPNQAYWCQYARDWITVKAYWDLTVTEAERDELALMVETC